MCDALVCNVEKNRKIVVLNADSAKAMKLDPLKQKFPENLLCFGISEADMLVEAAGMSTTGIIPVVVGFAMFVTEKPFEQIRQAIAYPNLNVKIIATHAGLCVGKDGATHQALEDIAIMRTLPNFKIFVAADVNEAKKAVDALIEHEGPGYLRLGRDLAVDIFESDKEVVPGGCDLLLEGEDAAVFACGLLVEPALRAAEILKKQDIKISVVNAYSIKPFNKDVLIEQAKKTGFIVSAEDHSVVGGLGSTMSEILSREYPVLMDFIGVQDRFGESGDQDELYKKYGLTADDIVAAVKNGIARKTSRR